MPHATYYRHRHHPIAVRLNGDDDERHLSIADAKALLFALLDALDEANADTPPAPHDTLPSAGIQVEAVASVQPVPDAAPTEPRHVEHNVEHVHVWDSRGFGELDL